MSRSEKRKLLSTQFENEGQTCIYDYHEHGICIYDYHEMTVRVVKQTENWPYMATKTQKLNPTEFDAAPPFVHPFMESVHAYKKN